MSLQLIAAALWAVSLVVVGIWQNAAGRSACELSKITAEKTLKDVFDESEKGAARSISKIKVSNATIKHTVERETREVPAYRDCVHTPDSLSGINNALAGFPVSPGDIELP